MEFDDWYRTVQARATHNRDACKNAWDVAQSEEREACANTCELQAVGYRNVFGNHCAAIIRERYNAESELNARLGDKCVEHRFIGMNASFIHEPEVGAWPIVTVRFALDDWQSRGAFLKHFQW